MHRSRHRHRPAALLGVAAVLLLPLAGCASDDGARVTEIGGDADSSSGGGSGSASASGPAPGSASSGDAASTDADGGYTYVSDVAAHRLVVEDVCDVKELLDADEIDYAAVAAIYTEGRHSVNDDGSVRTLAGFATAEDRRHGLDAHFDSATPLDDFVRAAIEGSGAFADERDAVRAQAIEKGLQNQVMVAWVVHELASAVAKAEDGDLDPATGAPHNWDEAWAFYHGAAPACAPYATADSRAENFGTTDEEGTARANVDLLEAMEDGLDALLAEDVEGAAAAADDVLRNLVITYSQAAIRYATLAAGDVADGDEATAREHQVEGLAFWRVIEPYVAAQGADVDAVNAILGLDAAPGSGDGDDVRAALRPAWDALDITLDDIGSLQ